MGKYLAYAKSRTEKYLPHSDRILHNLPPQFCCRPQPCRDPTGQEAIETYGKRISACGLHLPVLLSSCFHQPIAFQTVKIILQMQYLNTLDRGIYKARSKARMTRVIRTVNTVNAAFSKSVSCTSIGRNSVRQPI